MTGRVPCRQCGTENHLGFSTCFSCGAALSASTGIRKGSILAGRYEILSPLGRGGMGVVYKAHDRSLDELVAVKLLREDLVATPDLKRRFLSEIKLARRVRHPNVCAIHEYGEDSGTQYIAMEFIEGVNLRQVLEERGPLPAGEAAGIGGQLARGLAAIHAVGIVHRDLKTPNIMRDARGAVRLMDFGIAKSIDSETHATATGSLVGTPEYMSPEQARGDKVDVRSDLYSLGIVVFELLTGRVPFRAETPLAVLMKHIHEEPPWAEAAARAEISTAARSVLQRALSKEPGQRFQSASELAEALESIARVSETAQVSKPTAWIPPRHQGATALQPAETPSPREAALATATHVPTPMPTRPPAAATVNDAPVVAAPRPRPHKGATVAAAVAVVAAVGGGWAFWGTLQKAPPSLPDAGELSAAAHMSPPTTLAGRPVVARPVVPTADTGARANVSAFPDSKKPRSPASPAVVPSASEARRDRSATGAERPEAVPPVVPDPTPAPRVETVSVPPATLPPAAPVTLAAAAPPVAVAAAPEPAAARPAPAGRGLLMIQVKPEAEISIDGESVGRMGSYTHPIAAGLHTVVFTHPRYQPLSRKVDIAANDRVKLVVDLKDDALPRKK
jgi:predicted Ser/Thr protein kinase